MSVYWALYVIRDMSGAGSWQVYINMGKNSTIYV